MKANKGFKTTKKTHLFATRGFLTFLVIKKEVKEEAIILGKPGGQRRR